MVNVYELVGPDTSGDEVGYSSIGGGPLPDNEGIQTAVNLAAAFDITLRIPANRDVWDQMGPIPAGTIFDDRASGNFQIGGRDGFNEDRSVAIDSQTQEFGFSSEIDADNTSTKFDDECGTCPPATLTEQEAVADMRNRLQRIGLDPDGFIYETTTVGYLTNGPPEPGEPTRFVDVTAFEVVDGIRTTLRSFFRYGAGDQLLRAHGRMRRPVLIDSVGLLTPTEALTSSGQRDALETTGEITDAELVWDSTFSRETFRSFLVPHYVVTLNEELELAVNVPAIRFTDIDL